MGQFRKKPVVIEAVQYLGIDVDPGKYAEPRFAEPAPWISEAIGKGVAEGGIWVRVEGAESTLMIGTLESPHEASPGDWIARGIKGELYPIKPEIFAELYDPA